MIFARSFVREGLRQVYLKPETLTPESVREYSDAYRTYRGAVSYQRVCRAVRPERLVDYYSRYPRMKTPILILHGDKDNVVPRWVPEKLNEEIPDSRYERMSDAGHMLPEEESERLAKAIHDFE
jgi:pimeloyl-ACP methyl ester carboxylesterase